MNKNIFKKFLVGLLAFNILTTGVFSVQGNNNKITYAEEKRVEEVDIILALSTQNNEKKEVVMGNYEFDILNKKTEEVIKSVSFNKDMGMLYFTLPDGEYIIRLKKNKDYTMKDAVLKVFSSGNLESFPYHINGKEETELDLIKITSEEDSEIKENVELVNVMLMLTTQNGESKAPVMGKYEFDIIDNHTKEHISVSSDNGMLNFNLQDGEYTIKLKKNNDYTMEDSKLDVFDSSYEDHQAKWYINDNEPLLNLVKITDEESNTESGEFVGASEVKVKVLFDNKPKANFDVGLFEFDPIPNIILQKHTNSEGELIFNGFKPNLKYEIRLRSTDKTMTFKTEVFELRTNEKGLVTSINEKSIKSQEDAKVIFEGTNKDSETLKRFPVSFYVYFEDGTPAKDVEFAINRLSPRLSAYRKVKSDEKGKITVNLEGEAQREGSNGRLYNITISKMEMFKHNSNPVAIDFNVDENGNVKVIKIEKEENKIENVNSNLNDNNSKFVIKRVNKEYILDDFKAMYEKAINYLKNTKFMKNEQSDKLLKNFERAIDAAKLELEETIPEYASMKTNQLQDAMDKLKPFEIPANDLIKSWEDIDGTWYYRNSAKEDIYKNSWAKIDNVWYRFDKDGKMLSNTWFKDSDGKWYWLESSGAMSENEWIDVDGNWFWANKDGSIAENEWVYADGNWFWAKSGGYIADSEWIDVENKWYYAKAGGYIAQNELFKVDGIFYSFNSNGVWIR